MSTYFIQNFLTPFTSLENFEPKFLSDLEITDDDKRYLSHFIILNVFFDTYDDLWKNLGLSYFTVRSYFENNDDFIIVKDDTRSLYTKALSFINEKFSGLVLKVPIIYPQLDKRLIVSSYDDLFDESKILNTAIYLTLKYAKPQIDTVQFDVTIQSDVSFVGD